MHECGAGPGGTGMGVATGGVRVRRAVDWGGKGPGTPPCSTSHRPWGAGITTVRRRNYWIRFGASLQGAVSSDCRLNGTIKFAVLSTLRAGLRARATCSSCGDGAGPQSAAPGRVLRKGWYTPRLVAPWYPTGEAQSGKEARLPLAAPARGFKQASGFNVRLASSKSGNEMQVSSEGRTMMAG